jgi:hypothetical protein
MKYKFGIRINPPIGEGWHKTLEVYLREDSDLIPDFNGYKSGYRDASQFEQNLAFAYAELAETIVKLENKGIGPTAIKVYTTAKTKSVSVNRMLYTFKQYLEHYRQEKRFLSSDILKTFLTERINTIKADVWDYVTQSSNTQWRHFHKNGTLTWQLSAIANYFTHLGYYASHDAMLVDVGINRQQVKTWQEVERDFKITKADYELQLNLNSEIGFATDTLSVLRICYERVRTPRPDIVPNIDNNLFSAD